MFKKWLALEATVIFLAMVFTGLESCKPKNDIEKREETKANKQNTERPKKKLAQEFKDYWYSGTAEITSYKLEQARYGEMREGKAVMIYVTEPFLKDKQVKADHSNPDNVPVLKLNATKKYLTGIYPYSIMTSTFYPVYDNQHAIKVSFSSQEWCGHVYAQLNNRADFEVQSHSYFESEADQEVTLEKTILENELWNKIRISPQDLPQGPSMIIPSLEFTRLSHKALKAYEGNAALKKNKETYIYEIHYPELERTLTINFSASFPYTIDSWTETFPSGFGSNIELLTSKATKIKSINTPYWQQNGNKDLYLRDSLGL